MGKEVCVVEALAVANNRIFFTDNSSNCIFEYLPELEKLDFVGQFDSENPTGINLFERSTVKDDVVAFIPRQADNLCFFNTKTLEIKNVRLPDELIGKESKFRTGIWSDDSVYLFGALVNDIWKYNISDNKFIKVYTVENADGAFFEDCCIESDVIYAVNIKNATLLELNVETDQITEHRIQGVQSGFDYIVKTKDSLFLLPYKGDNVVEYIISTKESKVISIDENIMEWGIGGGVVEGNELIIYRKCDEPLIAIDIDSFRKRYIKFDTHDIDDICKRSFKSFNRPLICEGDVICSIQKSGWILKNDNSYKWIKPEMIENPTKKWKFRLEDVSLVEEQVFFRVDSFIDLLMEQ